jgi:hypothetical protein
MNSHSLLFGVFLLPDAGAQVFARALHPAALVKAGSLVIIRIYKLIDFKHGPPQFCQGRLFLAEQGIDLAFKRGEFSHKKSTLCLACQLDEHGVQVITKSFDLRIAA